MVLGLVKFFAVIAICGTLYFIGWLAQLCSELKGD